MWIALDKFWNINRRPLSPKNSSVRQKTSVDFHWKRRSIIEVYKFCHCNILSPFEKFIFVFLRIAYNLLLVDLFILSGVSAIFFFL